MTPFPIDCLVTKLLMAAISPSILPRHHFIVNLHIATGFCGGSAPSNLQVYRISKGCFKWRVGAFVLIRENGAAHCPWLDSPSFSCRCCGACALIYVFSLDKHILVDKFCQVSSRLTVDRKDCLPIMMQLESMTGTKANWIYKYRLHPIGMLGLHTHAPACFPDCVVPRGCPYSPVICLQCRCSDFPILLQRRHLPRSSHSQTPPAISFKRRLFRILRLCGRSNPFQSRVGTGSVGTALAAIVFLLTARPPLLLLQIGFSLAP